MTVAYNPLSGNLEIKEPGPQGPAGVVSAAGPGSQGTPSISFAADLDTGLYNYTPNGVAISTNGTGKLFVDSSGNVGVGTANPGSFQSNATQLVIQNNGGAAGITIDSTSTSSSNIHFADGATGNESYRGIIQYTHSDDAFRFSTAATEKLRITSTGELKHLGGGSEGDPAVYFAGSAPAKSLYVEATTGHVGLGTSSPSDPFHIAVSGANSASIRLQSGDGRTYNIGSTGTGYGSAGKFIIYDITAAAERFCVNSSGNVGVGTTEPSAKLHVAGSTILGDDGTNGRFSVETNTSRIALLASTTGFSAYENLEVYAAETIFHKGSTGEAARIDSSGTFHVVGAGTGGVNYAASFSGSAPVNSLNLDSSGRLLVGTSTSVAADDSKLQVLVTRSDSLGGISLTNNQWYGNGSRILFQNAINSAGTITPVASITGEGDGADKGRLVFSTTADGASSPTPRVQINSSGALQLLAGCPGIDFSGIQTNAAGMTSETLDSYEEGTWTPDQGGGLTVNGAFSSSAAYIKVGNIVHVRGYLAGATNISVSAGGVLCTNLPFTTHTLDGCGGNATTYNINETTGLYATGSGTTLYSNSALSASTQIIFGFTYRAN